MKVYIKAYEGVYGGYHGICREDIVEVSSIEEIDDIALEMAYYVTEDYGHLFDEDDECDPEYCWDTYVVSDELSLEEALEKLDELGGDEFVEEFCEEV